MIHPLIFSTPHRKNLFRRFGRRRVFLAVNLDLRLADAPVLGGDVVHDGGDVLSAANPCGFIY